jgi:hypothetical protein
MTQKIVKISQNRYERVISPVGTGKTMLKSQWDRPQYG